MKKTLYYESVLKRNGVIGEKVADLSMFILSLPKTILDVFLRTGMGVRYLTTPYVVLAGAGAYFLPRPLSLIMGYGWERTTLYNMFLIAYAIMAILRFIEIYRQPSVFDFAKYSRSTGRPFDFFYKIALFGKRPSVRTVDIYYEPLFCFLIGVCLFFFEQFSLGLLIIFCSLAYHITNSLAARMGDHFVMDKIDEIICNQELSESFALNSDVSPRGVPVSLHKPSTAELRQQLADSLVGDLDREDEITVK